MKYYKFKWQDIVMIILVPLVIVGYPSIFNVYWLAGISFMYGGYVFVGLFSALLRYNADKKGILTQLENIFETRGGITK